MEEGQILELETLNGDEHQIVEADISMDVPISESQTTVVQAVEEDQEAIQAIISPEDV